MESASFGRSNVCSVVQAASISRTPRRVASSNECRHWLGQSWTWVGLIHGLGWVGSRIFDYLMGWVGLGPIFPTF
jgi:hypothetical protein